MSIVRRLVFGLLVCVTSTVEADEALPASEMALADPFKVMWFNILADSFGGPSWEWGGPDNRRDRVAAILLQEDADLIGLQEVTDSQLPDLVSFLPEHDYFNADTNPANNVILSRILGAHQ